MARLARPTPSSEPALRLLRAAAIAYVTVASFPPAYAYYSLHPGLDISWVYGLNAFGMDPWRFGRDLNFTFGPLGFLLFPANFGSHVLYAIVFRFAVAALFALSFSLLSRPGRTPGFLLFAGGYGVGLGLGHVYEFHLLIVVAVAELAALERRSLTGLLLVAALSAPLALTKFSLGPGAASVVVAGAVAHVALNRASVRGAWTVVATHLAVLLASAWLTMGSLHDVALWLRASVEIANGYSVAMTIDSGWSDHRLGIAICVLFPITAAALHRMRSPATGMLLLLAGTVFLAYKSGFVREDGHVITFYGFAVAGTAAASIATTSAKERLTLAIVLLAITGIGLEGETRRGYLRPAGFWESASGRTGARGLARALRPAALRRDLDRETAAALEPDRLPQDLRDGMGNGRVLVMPTELLYCLANELNCVPPRTLQLYSAYTPYLDGIVAAQLLGPGAPDIVLLHDVATIDMRHLVLDGPLTWRAVLAAYEPTALSQAGAILRRRSAGARVVRPVASDTLRFGAWLRVPPSQTEWLFLEIPFAMTFRGKLTKAVHRIPAGYIQLRRASGAVEQHRLLFDMARNGLLIHPFASKLRDLTDLFQGRDPDPVVALRVFGAATRFYRDATPVTWLVEEATANDEEMNTAPRRAAAAE